MDKYLKLAIFFLALAIIASIVPHFLPECNWCKPGEVCALIYRLCPEALIAGLATWVFGLLAVLFLALYSVQPREPFTVRCAFRGLILGAMIFGFAFFLSAGYLEQSKFLAYFPTIFLILGPILGWYLGKKRSLSNTRNHV